MKENVRIKIVSFKVEGAKRSFLPWKKKKPVGVLFHAGLSKQ